MWRFVCKRFFLAKYQALLQLWRIRPGLKCGKVPKRYDQDCSIDDKSKKESFQVNIANFE